MVGILVSSWDGLFSGAMLVSGRVPFLGSAPHISVLSGATCSQLVRGRHAESGGRGCEMGGGTFLDTGKSTGYSLHLEDHTI